MKRKQILMLLISVGMVLGLMLTVFMSACAPTAPVEKEKVWQFADMWPFSGAYAGWGWIWNVSSEIWADDVNAAGGVIVDGESYRVEIVKYDNQMDPTVCLTVARKAIYDDGIKYISTASTDESTAINEICNTEKVLHVACSPYMSDQMGPDFPYTFQTWPEMSEPISVAFKAAQEIYPEYTRAAAIVPDDLRGHGAADSFQEEASVLGYTIVDTVYSAPDTVDFYSILTALLAKDVDILLNPTWGYDSGGQMVKQARELGFDKLIIFSDTMDIGIVGGIAGIEALEGIIVTPQQGEMFTSVGAAWAEKYTARYGSLQYWASYRYDELSLIKLAIEKANSFDPEKVIEVIGEVQYDGVSGPTSFATNIFTHGLPRYLKVQIPAVIIRNGEMVDIYQGFSGLWD